MPNLQSLVVPLYLPLCAICGDKCTDKIEVDYDNETSHLCDECAYDIFQQVENILERDRAENQE